MEIKRLPILAIETFKTINNVNPSYMKNIFTSKVTATVHLSDIAFR